MTVLNPISKYSYDGNGSTTVFSFPTYFIAKADVKVMLVDGAGVETPLALTTDYTLSGEGNSAGGSVTALVAPPVGKKIVIYLDPPITQQAQYTETGKFPAASHEKALDKLTQIAQRLDQRVDDHESRIITGEEAEQAAAIAISARDTTIGAKDIAVTASASAAASAASAALVTGAVPRVNNAALKALDATQITKAYLTDSNREGWFHFLSGDYSAQIAADAQEYNYIKATALATTVGAWVRKAGGNPLAHVSVTRLPVGRITLPVTFNNPLAASLYWDGSLVQYETIPYDLIDFEKYLTCNYYYVNYALGNNANAGTASGASAWKTLDYAIANAVSPAVVIVEDVWCGYLSINSAAKVFTGKLKIKGLSTRTKILAMRESYNTASFAFSASGSNGTYISTTAASKFFRAQFDSKYKDARGFPRPLTVTTGTTAPAGGEIPVGTAYWDSVGLDLYVHMHDHRLPDQANGWEYAEAPYKFEIQNAGTTSSDIILMENFEFFNNVGTINTVGVFRYRSSGTAVNGARLGLRNCLAYGGSGNGFQVYDAAVVAMDNCHVAYCGVDGFNYHSFVATGTKGEYITVYEHNCSSRSTGYTGFADQGTPSDSSNGSTSHDSLQIIRTNGSFSECHGSVIADVNGVHSLNYNVQAGRPNGPTPLGRACFWHDNFLAAGNVSARYMLVWGCSGFDGGDPTVSLLDNTAQSGGANGEIRVQYWLGQTVGKVVGALKDAAGVAL